jgi:hypothetical protein
LAKVRLAQTTQEVLADIRLADQQQAFPDDPATSTFRTAVVSPTATSEQVAAAGARLRSARADSRLPAESQTSPQLSGREARRRTLLLSLSGLSVKAITFFVLILASLQAEYFTNATFGADPIKDYTTLFISALGTSAAATLVSGVVSNASAAGS